ncbi:MAG: FlgD immunoglobulin-like domain containing protein, partial [Candidatus Neomarinimicrobiota bacterium]
LDYTSKVNVTVYNVLGNEVITLQNGELITGTYAIQWNANNTQGQKVPSGLYLYKVTSDNRILTGKMLLMK